VAQSLHPALTPSLAFTRPSSLLYPGSGAPAKASGEPILRGRPIPPGLAQCVRAEVGGPWNRGRREGGE
jgi:hypothetical protein